MQNPRFPSKIKIQKNMSKSTLEIIYSYFLQKTARKNTKYSKNDTILKIGHHAQAMHNPHFASKIKISKNISKSIPQIIYCYFLQKTARKNTKYSRNETILEIAHHAKADAKSSLWVKN